MSVARELLERWLDDTIFEPEELDSLMEETRELLAQPEQKPLTPQQISEGNQSMLNVTRDAFVKGVKYAEKMHGITGGGE
jgi:hypothetical protein